MRKLTFDRKTAYLTEKQVKQLIAYLDPKDAEHIGSYSRIKKWSPLCNVSSAFATPDCTLCPIGAGIGNHGCTRITSNFGKDYDYNVVFDTTEIHWRPENNRGARNALERIRKRLRELPRT